MKKVYLDNAATTQVRTRVIDKMQKALGNFYGNPSSAHSFGRSAKTAVESARKTIAKYINAQPSEIIFTSGGTEADNMVLRSAVRDLGVKTIITSKIEHHAVIHTVQELENEYGIQLLYVDLDEYGSPIMSHLETLLQNDNTKKLVSLMHINNELGNKLDISVVCKLCADNNSLFHSDTVQSIGHYSWNMQLTPLDFMVASAHKFHGPKGVGFAYIKRNTGIKPMIFGGAQERGARGGTEPFHNIVGLEEAFIAAYDNLYEETTYIKSLKKYFIDKITAVITGVKFNGHSADIDKSTYTLVNVLLPIEEKKAKMLLFHLDMKGIACSQGSACQSGSNIGSHVLSEILSSEDMKKPSLRFSFSRYTTKEEIDYTIDILKEYMSN